ncbi:MAG: GIY-YIG nuclease family protein [Candidatus Acidoferrales bacterium]
MARRYYVYILASRSLNLYTGVTNNLKRRVLEHKQGLLEGFTKKYRIERLVYFEEFANAREAIAGEKRIKAWRRQKKLALIRTVNPGWLDWAEHWYDKKQLRHADPSPRSFGARDDRLNKCRSGRTSRKS